MGNVKKKRIFIGSSTQSKDIAQKIATILENCDAQVNCWFNIPTFTPGQYTWENLMKIVNDYDGAVFVLSKDDVISIEGGSEKDRKSFTARDNVLIEAGLFYGVLGKKGVALYHSEDVKMPTDWQGLTTIRATMEQRHILAEELKAWLKEVKYKHNKKPHNVHMQSKKEINSHYTIAERLGLNDDSLNHITHVRILNFASTLLINSDKAAETRHRDDPNLPYVIHSILKNKEASLELILAEPTEAVLKDVQTKIANGRVGPHGAIYSVQNKIYELLKSDDIFKEVKRNGRFSYCVTSISIPFAIFNVEFDNEYSYLNHVRIDLYSAKLLAEDDRRSMIIWQTQDEDNYKFFVDNFNAIRRDDGICRPPSESELKHWSEKWSKIKVGME